MDEAGTNQRFVGRTESDIRFQMCLRIPSYIAYLDDDTRPEVEAKDYVVEVNDVGVYSMDNLLVDLASKTKWDACQQPTFWYWDVEKRGLQCVASNTDLNLVFQKFQTCNTISFVVKFVIKPAYQRSMTMKHKLEKLPVRRNSNVAPGTNSLEDFDDESGENNVDEENLDSSWMDNEDIFMNDDEVFVSLGLRAEDEASKLNLQRDSLDSGHDAQILVDGEAENEPRFSIDKKNPKIKKGETFPSMVDFRMALRQYAILKEFEVHKVVTDKKRYRAECKAKRCPWRIVTNKLVGQPTVEITMIPDEHEYTGTSKLVSTMASAKWVSERVVAWLRKKPSLGAAELQDKLLEKYGVEISYNTVWAGRRKAMDSIYGA